ncbi:2-pyrone-4,6-dicarboxylate hydrolase [Burkholderia sp. FL-7-2-10-S1-D7]|uniref:amidohydrolase family protein n=1 Tax=Burkholderia sp. FL-7-2-10-S1-D7 TaxID=1637866 RepID=UPI00075ADD1E|nr:amidohydrolase family protein [Burkholderia sp. FL-7-2-10-S1-D7]KVF76490.1 2-pyrone-4,6-dicarboxylate hydrolase [Burkholderia sp. FL-7-2-10-S1-D7]
MRACDAHLHVFDSRFRSEPDAQVFANATADNYRRAIQAQLGTTRAVVVTPRAYATDNSVTLDAIRQLGAERTRGVGVVRADVSDTELHALHDGGIRGIRFTLYRPEHAPTRFDMVEALSARVHALGWHVQLHWTADQIAAHEALLMRLQSTIVFDHMARLPQPAGTSHPAYGIVRRLVDQGRTWVKLSGPYLDSRAGVLGRFADIDTVARAWAVAAPERLVWGSDWPHATESATPDDARLFDQLADWVPDERLRERILVDNPARLYDFPD